MSAHPFSPARAAATHGLHPPRGGTAPGHLLPARSGLTPEAALALVTRPGATADSLLARACVTVTTHFGGQSREGRLATVLLASIPEAHGGTKR